MKYCLSRMKVSLKSTFETTRSPVSIASIKEDDKGGHMGMLLTSLLFKVSSR